MKTTEYLSISEVLELHKMTIEKHGGKSGVRDMGLLESALLRCQSGYYNTLAEQGASLLQSLCMNHCFVDGNKRVALLSTVVFFKMNGYNVKVTNKDIVSFIINDIIISKIEIGQITIWLSKKLSKL
jgi:death-on-curing protein